MEKIIERFLTYVTFNTQSKEDSETFPSTHGQLVFAKFLKEELKRIGVECYVDSNGYVCALLRSNMERPVPGIGFIAHMDTSPEVSGENVKPRIIQNYKGEDIVLNEKEGGVVLSPSRFQQLLTFVGQDLIVTDGTTLLGSDDKAGVAEIIQAVQEILEENIAHGYIYIVLTPDEEIGRGTDRLDYEFFKPEFAFTLDGEGYGIFEYENFNAASAHFHVKGINTHPGIAKGAMKNAINIASELMSLFPSGERPEVTEGYEGFYHFYETKGGVQDMYLKMIVRDHDRSKFEKRKEFCSSASRFLNEKYGQGTVVLEMQDSYYNMREIVEKCPKVLEVARKAFEAEGLEFKTRPIRGGTDGAKITYKGIPTPNIFSGGMNLHSVYEYVSVQSMKKAKDVIKRIVQIVASS